MIAFFNILYTQLAYVGCQTNATRHEAAASNVMIIPKVHVYIETEDINRFSHILWAIEYIHVK